MKPLNRLLCLLLLLAAGNMIPLLMWLPITAAWQSVVIILALAVFYLIFSIRPTWHKHATVRLRVLYGGYELIICSALASVAEAVLYLIFWLTQPQLFTPPEAAVINALIAVLLYFLLTLNGLARIIFTSAQAGVLWRFALFFVWWVPLLNLFVVYKLCSIVRREYYTELSRIELDETRRENEVCHTRYPVILVHGVFFRDWQLMNYWGRIPKELKRNGAVLGYGGQQSAEGVAKSAQELKEHVLAFMEENGCEKVNLIAHSKGGLDSRYAISHLGLDSCVASLTTINTPHRGCKWAEKLLHTLPKGVLAAMEKGYNAAFKKLGDAEPDFMTAVWDLTASHCEELNQTAPDMPGVLYQSYMSVMSSMLSDGVPLCLTNPYIKGIEGKNDGLVAVPSAAWGDYRGLLTTRGRRGISHGDMIDLRRENIKGFDVREFYVNIVKELKNKGL